MSDGNLNKLSFFQHIYNLIVRKYYADFQIGIGCKNAHVNYI